VLTRLRERNPRWFCDGAVRLRADGTFELPVCVGDASGTLATLYHPESRSHFLAVECGGLLSGSAPLYDGSKATYNTFVDFDKVLSMVDELVEELDGAQQAWDCQPYEIASLDRCWPHR